MQEIGMESKEEDENKLHFHFIIYQIPELRTSIIFLLSLSLYFQILEEC